MENLKKEKGTSKSETEGIKDNTSTMKKENEKNVSAETFYCVYGVVALMVLIFLLWQMFFSNLVDWIKIISALTIITLFSVFSFYSLKYFNIKNRRVLEIMQADEDWEKLLMLLSYCYQDSKKGDKYLL